MIVCASLCRWSPAGNVVDELGPRLAEALAAIPGLWASGKTAADARFQPAPDPEGVNVLDIPTALDAETDGTICVRAHSKADRSIRLRVQGSWDIKNDLLSS